MSVPWTLSHRTVTTTATPVVRVKFSEHEFLKSPKFVVF